MNEFLTALDQWHAMEACFVASIVLILIDYFFTVDYPAYIAYLLCGAGVFLAFPSELPVRLAVGLGTWVVLLVLHRVWFSRYLTNAHEAAAEPQES